ncbi:RNase A-like domain-containing protein [Actinomadura rupiterrae]|uniref:RNase A-like domain-containing protein n=1 Tax=Actinomadura rupiterrae TaxID=559627 RepID=UPI0020A4646D|nr:RNase A-like domain-containing protein [Actinomadura rupiterrae]MCP2342537.1 hypothetical protein [Actinomadura rupiterrae]
MDVDPPKVYAAADATHRASDVFGTAMLNISRNLHGIDDMAGKDFGGEFLGALYDPLAQQMVITWERLVIALGGVCEGLTTTANNFVTADWHSKHGAGPVAGTKPVPQFHDFTYKRPASASGSGYLDASSFGGQLMSDAAFGALLKDFPRGHPDRLYRAAGQWRNAATAVQSLSAEVNRILDTITIDSQATGRRGITGQTVDTWQKQMRTFCSRIWGKAPWDGTNSSDAPLHILGQASIALATMCEHHAAATTQTRNALRQRAGSEVYDLLEKVATSEGAVVITAAVEAMFNPALLADCAYIIATKYFQPLNSFKQSWAAAGLLKALEDAAKRVPTLQAMEAQAESVGDRAMHDFKYPGLRGSDPGGKGADGRFKPPDQIKFPIDLAGQEGGPDSTHVIDKHVGKSDDQLKQRLAAQPGLQNASSFNSLSEAQRYVQEAINSPEGERKIKNMIDNHRQGTEFTIDTHTPVGRAVDRNGNVHYPTKVRVLIHAAKHGEVPPFYVNTAHPDL